MFKNQLFILYHYLKFRFARKFTSRAKLKKWQIKQWQRFCHTHLCRSPYYEGLLNKPLKQFPLINKTILMAQFNKMNTANIDKQHAFNIAKQAELSRDFKPMIKNIAVGLSSGTSGNYGLFLTNPKERLIWVSYILAKMLPKPIWHKQKIALFLRADNQLYQNLGMSSRIQFKFYDTFSSIEEHIKTLNQQQPDILVAPPNVLKILALAVINKELNLHPTRVISVADVLDPQDRHFISQTFKQTVHQLYQCTEGFIASTCRYGTLHVNEDLIIMEKQWIDRKLGKFVPVITDMQRHTQPIIRYQLNDILTIKHRPCACGSKFLALKSIEGRSDDILYFNSLDKKKKIRIFPDFIRHAIMTATDRNINYKVIQNSMDHLQVAIEADDGSIQSLAVENLRNLFERYRIIQPRIELINYQSPVLYEKQRRVQRILEVPIYEQAS